MFDCISEDTMIDIKVSGKFYGDIKKIFIDMLIENETKEAMGVILTNLSQRKITTNKEFRLFPFYILLLQIEHEGKKQGLTTKAPAPKIIPDVEN